MTPIPKTSNHSYRPEIDGIRALAVTGVIVNHFNKDILPSGYLGVDIFFVISGYVITSSLANRHSKNFQDFIVGFYTRRIKRLVPALVLFVLVTSIAICLFNPDPDLSLKTGITSLFGLSNLYLLKQSTDYFATSTELNVFTHTWSLGVEEQFYFVFPFLVWLTGFGRLSAKGSRNLFWVTAVLSVASLISFAFIYPINQANAYFLMPTRLWEMGAGCLLFLALKQYKKFVHLFESLPPLIVTAAIVGILFVPLELAVPATITVVCLTVLLIASVRSETTAYKIFTHPKVVYIGLISYSLYLWHWGVLSISRWTIGIHWWSVPIQLGLMLLLAIASYRYLETPLRRSDWSAIRWRSIAYGISASVFAATAVLALIKIPNLSLYTGRNPSTAKSGLRHTYFLKQTNSVWRGDKCALASNSEVGKKIALENCTLGNFSTAKKRVMVLGNSFAPSFTEAFDDIVISDGYSVTLAASWSASPVREVTNTGNWAKANYYYWDNVIPSLINPLKSGDWVFLIYDMAKFSPKNPTSETNESLKQLESGLEAFSDKLSARGIRLAILHGNPFAREANCQPVSAVKQWFSPFGSPCKLPNKRDSLLRRNNLNQILVSLEAKGKLSIVDLFDIFCPDKECTYHSKNGQLLYRDEYSHPSVEAARLSAPIIRRVLTSR